VRVRFLLPDYVSRLILIAGQVGARQNVWFNLTDDMVDLRRGTMTIPSALAKNRLEHLIYLTRLEASLLSELLMVRVPGASLVFPTRLNRNGSARVMVRMGGTGLEPVTPSYDSWGSGTKRADGATCAHVSTLCQRRESKTAPTTAPCTRWQLGIVGHA
jgi:hypothetical protein